MNVGKSSCCDWGCNMKENVKFSLLLGTLNRPEILSICLNKLKEQTYKNFEVIIIDQNDNDKTERVVKEFSGIDIKYKRVNFRGLSKARNAAIGLMCGTHFCLIDDDADYSNDYLENIVKSLRNNNKAVISGYILNTNTKKGIVNYGRIKNGCQISLRETIRLCPFGLFDEEFGIGAMFGAAEETDYLLRCRKKGYTIIHDPNVYVEHPIVLKQFQQAEGISIDKVKSYAMGLGALYKKHLKYYKEFELIPVLIDNIVRLLVKKIISRNNVADARFYGFIEGWKQYKAR